MKIKLRQSIIDIILCILVFLIGSSFLGLSSLYFVVLGFICLVRAILRKRFIITRSFLLIVVFCFFSLLSLILAKNINTTYFSQFVLVPFLSYFIFCDIRERNIAGEQELSKFTSKFFLSFFLGIAFYVLLSFVGTVNYLGFKLTERVIANPWVFTSNTTPRFLTSTVLSMPCSIIVFYFIALFYKKKKIIPLILSFLLTVIITYFSLKVSNRGFVVAIALSIIIIAFYFDNLCINVKRRKIIISIINTCIALAVIAILIKLFKPDLLDRLSINKIAIVERFIKGGTDSYRLEHYLEFFNSFYKYPFGGLNRHVTYDYVHNTIFDVYNIVGLIPMLCYTFLFIRFFFDSNYVIKYSDKTKNKFEVLFIFFMIIPYLSISLIEPVWNGNPYIFGLVLSMLLINNQYAVELKAKYDKNKCEIPSDYKVLFINKSLINHVAPLHQKFCDEYGEKYKCITLEDINDDHKKYETVNEYSNVLRLDVNNATDLEQIKKEIDEANVIIYSNCPRKLLFSIFKKNKLIFQLSERPYAKQSYEYLKPKSLFNSLMYLLFFEKYHPICLSASIYTPFDYSLANHCVNRCYFFPYLFEKTNINFRESGKKLNLLFVNRFVDWKHPEKVVEIAKRLKDDGRDFVLNIVGFGDSNIENSLKEYIKANDLTANVKLLGALQNNEVKKLMANSDILFSTSNITERCGCTVVEGMSNGCCVIASHYTGSAPLLINSGINGLIYDFDNDDTLYSAIDYCFDNIPNLNKMRKEAFDDAQNIFNIDYEFNQLVNLINSLKDNNVDNCYVRKPLGLLKNVDETDVIINEKVYSAKQSNAIKAETNGVQNVSNISKTAIVSYISVALSVLIGFFYTPWIVNALGQSNYAIYSLAGSVIGLITIDIGISTAVSKLISSARLNNDSEQAKKSLGLIYKLLFIVGAILFAVLLILFFFLDNIYVSLSSDEIASLKVVYIMVAVFSLFAFECTPLDGILIANDKFKNIKLLNLFTKILDVIFVIIAISLKGGLLIFTFITVCSNTITLIVKAMIIKKQCKYGNNFVFEKTDKKDLTYVFKLVFWIAIASIASRFIITLQPTILGIFAGSNEIALFSLATSVESYFFIFSNAINGMLMPNASELKKRNASKEEYEEKMIKVGRIQLFFMMLILVGWVSLGRGFITHIWKVGNKDFSYENSYYIAILLIIPTLINSASSFGSLIMINEGKEKYLSFSMIVTALVSAGVSLVLCSIFKNNASIMAALAVFIGNLIGNFILLSYFYKKQLQINILNYHFKTLICVALGFIPSFALGIGLDLLLPTQSMVIFLFKGIVVVAIYFVNAILLTNAFEKKLINNLIIKTKRYLYHTNYVKENTIKLFNEPYKESTIQKDDVRILIVGTLPYFKDSQSRAFESYFSSFKKEQIRQIYSSPRIPQKGFSESLYQITDQTVLNNFLKFKKTPGTIYKDEDLKEQGFDNQSINVNTSLYNKGKKKTWFRRILRNIIWRKSNWCSKKLNDWVDEFKPNVIFLAWSDDCFIPRIATYLSKRFSCPIVSCIGDDYIFSTDKKSLMAKLYDESYSSITENILFNKFNFEIYIDDPIRDLYNKYYSKKGVTVHVGSDNKFIEKDIPKNLSRFCYFGNLGYNRIESIICFANELRKHNYDFVIDLYTKNFNDISILNQITGINGINIFAPVPHDSIESIMNKYDANLVVESLTNKKCIKLVKYSLSTKVADSLSCGLPTIAIGNENTGLIRYFISNECGVVLNNAPTLYDDFLRGIKSNQLMKYRENSKCVFERDFNKNASNTIFVEKVCRIVKGGLYV